MTTSMAFESNQITILERYLESARLRVEAAQTRLILTNAALNQLEAKVCSMGASPRYRVAWDQSLRNARNAEDDAKLALTDAQSDLEEISAKLATLIELQNATEQ